MAARDAGRALRAPSRRRPNRQLRARLMRVLLGRRANRLRAAGRRARLFYAANGAGHDVEFRNVRY